LFASADNRAVYPNSNKKETIMVLLASSYDQSRFFKAADLEAEKKLRIKSVTEEVIGVGADSNKALVVWFTNDERGLVLNKTNNRTLRGAFGDDCDGWAGKVIVVFPSTTDLRGKMVPSLRVRIPPPKQAAASNGAKPIAPEQAGNGAKPIAPEQTTVKPAVQPSSTDDMNDEIPW
jgi:hypothetical protein